MLRLRFSKQSKKIILALALIEDDSDKLPNFDQRPHLIRTIGGIAQTANPNRKIFTGIGLWKNPYGRIGYIVGNIESSYHRTLKRLREEGYVQLRRGRLSRFSLTDKGKAKAEELREEIKAYIDEWGVFVDGE